MLPILSRGEVDIEQSAHPMNDATEFLDRGLHTLGVAAPECSFPFAKPFSLVRVALTVDSPPNVSDRVGQIEVIHASSVTHSPITIHPQSGIRAGWR